VRRARKVLKIAVAAMKYQTKFFGWLDIGPEGILHFPDGIVGYETQRHWVLLAEEGDSNVGWLQSLTDPDLALSLVPPHRYVRNYVLRVDRREISCLPWTAEDRALLFVVISEREGKLTANLRAPIIINLDRGFGRQVVVADEQPVQYALSDSLAQIRKIA
jgi:flagellar assembly factor FliW